MRENGPMFSSVGYLSCRLWFLLCRLEQQVLIVEAEVSQWRHSSQPRAIDAAIGVQREGDKSVLDGAVAPVRFERFVLPVLQIAAHGRLGLGRRFAWLSTFAESTVQRQSALYKRWMWEPCAC